MTCNACGGRCGKRWTHPQQYEDYYCASCYIEMVDDLVEELQLDQTAARKAVRPKNSVHKQFVWKLVEKTKKDTQ